MPNVNDIAPDFTLVDTTKTPHTLSSYRGKKVLLAFYPGAFTGVCTKELCRFQDSLALLNGANAVILGVSADTPFANGAFAKANAIEFPLLSDYTGAAIAAYGITLENFAGLPGLTRSHRAVFLIDESGKITGKWQTANPGLEPDYEAILAAV